MSVNNLSPINQKVIESRKEEVIAPKPHVDLVQQADSVSFSGKKVARNTGVGTAIGAIFGTIYKTIAGKKATPLAEEEATLKALNELRSNVRNILDKIAQGTKLTEEETKIIQSFKLDNDLIKNLLCKHYVSYIYLNRMKKVFGDLPQGLNTEQLYEELKQTSNFQIGVLGQNINDIFIDELDNYYSGKTDCSEFLDCLNSYFKRYNVDLKKIVEEYHLKVNNDAGNSRSLAFEVWKKSLSEVPEDVDVYQIGEVVIEDYLIKDKNSQWAAAYQNLTKDRITELMENTKSQLTGKEIIKSAGIGAVIAGGIALVGSLIYKAVHNKKAVQDSQTIQ